MYNVGNTPIDFTNVPNLERLNIDECNYDIFAANDLPPKLTYIDVQTHAIINRLFIPRSVTELTVSCDAIALLSPGDLPDSLQSLVIHGTHLSIGAGILPAGLRSLKCTSTEPGALPPNLKILDLSGCKRGATIDLPQSLLELSIHIRVMYFDFEVVLPEKLQKLTIYGGYFNQCLSDMRLPDSLKELDLGHAYTYAIYASDLPPNLEILNIHGGFLCMAHTPIRFKK
jgi:Leucine-rich repeat (LRR) protein